MARVTGIGGVFLKSKGDAAALAQWYAKNLGIELESWGGAIMRWPDDRAAELDVSRTGLVVVGAIVAAALALGGALLWLHADDRSEGPTRNRFGNRSK